MVAARVRDVRREKSMVNRVNCKVLFCEVASLGRLGLGNEEVVQNREC